MKLSIRTLLASISFIAVCLVVFVQFQQCREVTAAKKWILEQDAAYCLTHPCPNGVRTGNEVPDFANCLTGIHGDEYSNPVKEIAFEFYTLYTFEPLTCLRKIERVAVETVMSGEIDMTPLVKLPRLAEISFCKEARDTPGFDTKIAQLKDMMPNLKIKYDTEHYCRRPQTSNQEWVIKPVQEIGE